MIKGIDVAHYEPVIDWQKVMDGGYRFAFIKCSQGTYNDSKFVEHWSNAKQAGMPRGAYHYFDAYYKPEDQAEKFYSSLHGDFGELPFVVDIEQFVEGPYFGSENWYKYINRLNQLSNNFPLVIYTAYYYWTDNVHKNPAVQDVDYFGRYPLWVADYHASSPLVPEPWKPYWLFWQYSESELIDGVYDQLGRQTECDADYFFGDEGQFQLLLDGIPPSGGNSVSTFYKATGNATIRIGPGSNYAQVPSGEPYVLINDIVESLVPQQNGWASVANIYRNDIKMNISNPAWCTAAYLQPTTYSPPSGTTPPPETGTDDFKLYRNDVLIYHIVGKEQPL